MSRIRGIRERKSKTRRLLNGQWDVYFSIKVPDGHGRIKEQGVGWVSEGYTLESVAIYRRQILNKLDDDAPRSVEEIRKREERKEKAREYASMSFGAYVTNEYLPWLKTECSENDREKLYQDDHDRLNKWVLPVIGHLPFSEITADHVKEYMRQMRKAGRAEQTVLHAMISVKKVYKRALSENVYTGACPVAAVRRPKLDNRRMRVLSAAEIKVALKELKKSSEDCHDQAMLSYHAGLRFGEVVALRVEHLDLAKSIVHILDAKAGSRDAYLSPSLVKMLQKRIGRRRTGLLFKPRGEDAEVIPQPSKTFQRVFDRLFNQGVKDRRLKVTFHTLRHSGTTLFAETSKGDAYKVQAFAGHKSLQTSARYVHVQAKAMKSLVAKMAKSLERRPAK